MCFVFTQPVLASFSSVMTAEFAEARGSKSLAMTLYEQEALNTNHIDIIEHSLSLAIEHKDNNAALTIAKHWVQVTPNDISALFYLAHIALQQNEFSIASNALDRILQLDPDAKLDRVLVGINPTDNASRDKLLKTLTPLSNTNPSLQILIAGLLSQNNRATEALVYLDAALKQRPNNMAYINLKAKHLMAMGDYTKLNTWLEDISRKQHKNKSLGLLHIRYLVLEKQYVLAQKQLQKVQKPWLKDPEFMFLASTIYTGLGEYTLAHHMLSKLTPFEQYQDQAYFQLAQIAALEHHLAEAESYFEQAQGDYFQLAQIELVKVRMATHRVDDAIHKLSDIRSKRPEYRTFTYQLQSQILVESNRSADAIALLDSALQEDTANATLLYAQFLILPRDAFETKEQLLKTLLDISPNEPAYLNAYAFILADENTRLKQAQFLINRALGFVPDQPNFLDTLGLIQYRKKNYTDAIQTLERAYAINADLGTGVHLLYALKAGKQDIRLEQLLTELRLRYPDHAAINAFINGQGI